jgi:hypothetical protein
VNFTNTRRLAFCAATLAALILAGCGSDRHSDRIGHAPEPLGGSVIAAASNGSAAVWRADITPIVCRYAQDIARSSHLIAQASSNAGGPVDASAPESAQTEYAGALQLYASLLTSDYASFVSVPAPPALSREYRQFLTSLHTLVEQADQLSQYAHARNFTAIANEQDIQIPTAGQQVFTDAGITSCTVPTP